jgi:hypothetical protein
MKVVSKDFENPGFPHGTIAGYRRGCKCDECRGANSLYQRNFRKGKVGNKNAPRSAKHTPAAKLDNVSQLIRRGETNDSPTVHGPGPNELALIADADSFADVPGKQILIEQGKTLCRILDNPREVGQHATASRGLMALIAALSAGARSKRKTGTRLATVSQLSKHRRAN